MLPPMMRAIAIETPGGPEVLKPLTLPIPQPKAGEVLIKVVAAGVNRPDLLQRQGTYPAPLEASPLPGLEVSGEIVAVGEGVAAALLGNRVCALTPGGGYAEYVIAPAGHCLPVPAPLSMIEAAALPEGAFTVWGNVFDRGRLQPGETLLIHGGTSGIGSLAIQMAKACGVTVLVTVGSDEKAAAARALGANLAINYRTEDFVEKVMAATEGRGADVILDMVGGGYIQRNIDCAALEGRIVFIAFQGGAKAEVDFRKVMMRRLTLTGTTLRPQSIAAKTRLARALAETMWPWVEKGLIRPHIFRVFPLAEAAAAHALLESGEPIGKIVLGLE
ncbi:MAG: NAD(P)H-quinone oxidoreductase [Elstera sp.]